MEDIHRVDSKVFQAVALGAMNRHLVELIKIVKTQKLNAMPFYRFVNVYQRRTVSAGETGALVWEFKVKPFVAYLQVIANSWNEDEVIHFFVDNQEVEPLERSISFINDPLILPKPYIARKSIRFVADNNSDTEDVFEVIADGQVYTVEEGKLLGATKPYGQ